MITVLRAPAFATVQDLGRIGHLSAAVPRAGALDPFALRVANLLVGNSRDAAVIEWGVGGGEIRFERDATIALAGATARAAIGGRPITKDRAEPVRAGECLRVERIEQGAWVYVAVSGGIDVPPVLGSRATYLPAHFGGLDGRLLRTGDQLPIGDAAQTPASRASLPAELASKGADEPIALLSGPDHAAAPAAWDWLLSTEFRVSRAVSRMGYRLEAQAPSFSVPGDRPSAPACPGTVQLPPGGAPIVLMPDGPTVGGYVRVAVVATADLGRVAQRAPGESVRFRMIEVHEARARLRRQEEVL
ncbi:MAG TPA: biotin-dependent carboxyltransferase family protein, partial [Gemmatimonadales bacterium]